MLKSIVFIVALAASAGALAHDNPLADAHYQVAYSLGPVAHIHGEAQLQVVLDGDQLYIAMQAPADTLLGFTGAPQTAEQLARERAVRKLLTEPLALWQLPAAAGCALTDDFDADMMELAWPSATGLAQHQNASVFWQFVCAQPQVLSQLQLPLFEHFAELETVSVQLVTEQAQRALTLTRKNTQLELR